MRKVATAQDENKREGWSATTATRAGKGGVENLTLIYSRRQRMEFRASRTATHLKKKS